MDARQSTEELPPLPTAPLPAPLRVVVLTCGDMGWEMAAALRAAPHVQVVGVVQTAYPRPASLKGRLRSVYRYQGLPGVARIPLNKLRALAARLVGRRRASAALPDVPHLVHRNFHDADCLAAVRALAPDLGIVDGTYVLKPAIYALPTFGSLNLHCGKLPDFRGAPPAFWELWTGATEVGVTVHRVTAKLDEGPILAQRVFPLDPVPPGDPVRYADAVYRTVLRPNGLRIMAEVTASIAAATATARPQGPTDTPTFKRPDHTVVRELRARVRERRRNAS